MGFELDKQPATLKSVTPRKETHGDQKVTAVSLGLKFTAPNTILDHLSPSLRTTFYKPVDDQPGLDGIDVPTPILRQPGILMVALKGQLDGWTLSVEHGIDEDDPIVCGGCKIDNFRVVPMQGGTVELHVRIGTSDIDGDEIGLLCSNLAEEIVVSITAPKPMEEPIDGSKEGGGPGFDEDAGSLFAQEHAEPEDDEDAGPDLEDRLDNALALADDETAAAREASRSPEVDGGTRTARGKSRTKAALAAGVED